MSRIQVPPLRRNEAAPVNTTVQKTETTASSMEDDYGRNEWLSLVRRVLPTIIQFKNPAVAVVPTGGFFPQNITTAMVPDLSMLNQKEWALVYCKVVDDNGFISTVIVEDIYVAAANGSIIINWANPIAAPQPTPENIFILAYRRT